MSDKATGITRIEHQSGSVRVIGVHEGVPSDVTIPTAHLDQFRQDGGEKAVRAYLERSLAGGRQDHVYDPQTGELRR